jgi:F-type H+-transporting ATPase subunit b
MHRILLLSLLALAAPAAAQDEHGTPPGVPRAEGIDPGFEHGAPEGQEALAGHGEAHGEGGHHGPHYTGDVDGDGVPNWRDPDADATLGEGTYVVPAIAWHAFNFAVLIGLILWLGRSGIKDSLHERAVKIRASVEEAASAKAAAEARQAEIAARLNRLEDEITAMKDRARAEALAEEARIAERADEAARRIAETAQRQIGDEAARARTALRAEAVDLAVKLAEGILRSNVGANDQRRLAEQFLASIDGEA